VNQGKSAAELLMGDWKKWSCRWYAL